MAELVLETPEGVRLRRELAGAGARAAAGAVDLALYLLGLLTALLALLLATLGDPTGISGFLLGVVVGGGVLGLVAYPIVFGLFWDGQTPGKRLLGLRVVDQHGLPAVPRQHVLRALFWPVEAALTIPLPLGLVLIAVTGRRQRLGDLVAGTVVLREGERAAEREPYPHQRWASLPARELRLTASHAARLDAEDLRRLRAVLSRLGIDPVARDRLLVRAARHFLDRAGVPLEGDPDPRRAESLLAELYLFVRDLRAAQPS